MSTYATPADGLPPQTQLHTGRAVFTDAYAVIPRGVMRDIVTSYLPGWEKTHAWILARPLSGFAETFAQYILLIDPEGGTTAQPEPDPQAQGVLFVLDGRATLTLDGQDHALAPGGYAYLAPGADWALRNDQSQPAQLVWVRKLYEPAPGLDTPDSFVTNEQHHVPAAMPGTKGAWATTRFVDPHDLRHDMHVNIVTFQPGGLIPFEETHVMEHGLYVLEGKAVYKLNKDWVEVEAGDFMWLRAFCPQACYAGGPGPFRYLLYKDVNRHPRLRSPWPGAPR
ncbi:(S)-ureidoglycine aminohydrolase [Rhodobacter sp. NTK016B]|uniref:bifunctional allantoicase/(S)-ureidoglycine aminohydrolase n=1 Tax=Rhodobacter sp. NTK016B TaxID=2759676 RepID=UPI001A8F346E|nr:bifunctional allantoicase/(S)-ureidoglycine aminohydrolase [Rhodobacter sp. NTK016B]MBN8294338.1 (S)-ureidoglycine aminohydrolase [Rhodobacter sp. NTK016B]